MADKEIVKKNLEMMTEEGEGKMFSLLCTESIGGNAGSWKGLSCACANFRYNCITGEIKYFGNYQEVPQHIRENYLEGYFRLAWDTHETRKFRVINYSLPNYTDEAKENIRESADEFNKREGFNSPEKVEFLEEPPNRKKKLKAMLSR